MNEAAKALAEKIDKQTEIITVAEQARGRHRSLSPRKPQQSESPLHRRTFFPVCACTGRHWRPHCKHCLGSDHPGRRGWDWRFGHGTGFGRPSVWRACSTSCQNTQTPILIGFENTIGTNLNAIFGEYSPKESSDSAWLERKPYKNRDLGCFGACRRKNLNKLLEPPRASFLQF